MNNQIIWPLRNSKSEVESCCESKNANSQECIKFTLFSGNNDKVAKGYDIVNGELTKVAAENFYHGTYETVSTTPEKLVSFIKSIKQGKFITAGINQKLLAGKCPTDASRTSEEFGLHNGAGLMIIDSDSLSDFGIGSNTIYVEKIRSLDSAMKSALMVMSPSASSGIEFNGSNSGLKGMHCFIPLDDAKAMPSILEILHKRSVLAGLVRAQITANGVVLIKSLVDLAMKSSNQPCYEGGARLLNAAVTQHRTIESCGRSVLKASDFKILTPVEEAEYEAICRKLKSDVNIEANAIRSAWRAVKESELISKGVTTEKATILLDQALDGGILSEEIEIQTDKFGPVTIAKILANPTRYHHATCADPMEPEYGGNKAKIYSCQNKPCIHSMKHGGVVYYMCKTQYTRSEFIAMIEATIDFDELTVRIAKLVSTSNLRESERDMIFKLISSKAKVTTASLKLDAKSFQKTNSDGAIDHIKVTQEVIKHFGEGNLLHVNGFVYIWREDGIWRKGDDREIKKVVHDIAPSSKLNSYSVGSILDMVKTEVNLPNHRFDVSPTSINCINGELVLQSWGWDLVPHVRAHYRTSMIQVAYDPKANAPLFCRFLTDIFDGDVDATEKVTIVLEALGYSLLPSCHLERFFILIGSGANGKSVLLRVLAELIGRQFACAVQPSQFENRFQRAHLQGKLVNIITEIAVGAEIADAQLKSLVSGEMTTAEHKHHDPFDFIPHAKHWFGTNHLPHTRDFSDALFRRAILLQFNNKFEGEDCDVNLANSLITELPGILNLALDGLKRLTINNAFTVCSSATQITNQWRLDADQVSQFVEDKCTVSATSCATSSVLFLSYKQWASSVGVRYALSRNSFTTRLVELGYSLGRGTGGTRMINGLLPK